MISFNQYVAEQLEQFNDGLITETELWAQLLHAGLGELTTVHPPKPDTELTS